MILFCFDETEKSQMVAKEIFLEMQRYFQSSLVLFVGFCDAKSEKKDTMMLNMSTFLTKQLDVNVSQKIMFCRREEDGLDAFDVDLVFRRVWWILLAEIHGTKRCSTIVKSDNLPSDLSTVPLDPFSALKVCEIEDIFMDYLKKHSASKILRFLKALDAVKGVVDRVEAFKIVYSAFIQDNEFENEYLMISQACMKRLKYLNDSNDASLDTTMFRDVIWVCNNQLVDYFRDMVKNAPKEVWNVFNRYRNDQSVVMMDQKRKIAVKLNTMLFDQDRPTEESLCVPDQFFRNYLAPYLKDIDNNGLKLQNRGVVTVKLLFCCSEPSWKDKGARYIALQVEGIRFSWNKSGLCVPTQISDGNVHHSITLIPGDLFVFDATEYSKLICSWNIHCSFSETEVSDYYKTVLSFVDASLFLFQMRDQSVAEMVKNEEVKLNNKIL